MLSDLDDTRVALEACKAAAEAMEDGGGDLLSKRLNAAQATLTTHETTDVHLVGKAKKVADALEAANKLMTAYTERAKRIAENGGTGRKRSRPAASKAAAPPPPAVPTVDEGALPTVALVGNPEWAPELKHHNAQRALLATHLKDDARPEVKALLQAYDRAYLSARDGVVKALTPATYVVDAAPLRAYEAALKGVQPATGAGKRAAPAPAPNGGGGGGKPTATAAAGKTIKCVRCERRLRPFAGSAKCRGCYFETIVENELSQFDARVDLLGAEVEEEKATAIESGIYDPDAPGDAETRFLRARDLSAKITELRDAAEEQKNSTAKYEKMRGLMRQLDGMVPSLGKSHACDDSRARAR